MNFKMNLKMNLFAVFLCAVVFNNHFIHAENPIESNSTKRILFLHIGKAGGGTITDFFMHNDLTQHIAKWHPQGLLTSELYHNFDHILINVRDPVARGISAINYECFTEQYKKKGTALGCCENRNRPACDRKAAYADEFEGSSNLIAEALSSSDKTTQEKAKVLMNQQFIHTKMSVSQHVGGMSVLKSLLAHGVRFYLTVLDDDFIPQILYQLSRIMIEVATDETERQRAIQLTEVPTPHRVHTSNSNYSVTSPGAEAALAERYAEDYEVISFLGDIGCGKSAACLKGVQNIVQEGIRLGKLDPTMVKEQHHTIDYINMKSGV
jgi:hypothetical protein